MALPHFSQKKRNFKICGSYRWEVTDKYGDSLSDDFIRDFTINEVLDIPNQEEVLYGIGLKRHQRSEQGWGQYQIIFENKYKILKLYSLGDGDIRVNLPCKTLDECEHLIKMLCVGNDMEVQPAYLSDCKWA